MMYKWTKDIIRFMSDASENSDYFSKLADFIEPFFKGAKVICDAGCGLGQLSAELGKRGYKVYACDISHDAIQYIKNKNYKNVIPVECNLHEHDFEFSFDAMIFNYFGSLDEVLEISERCCSGVTVIIKKNYKFHRFSFSENRIQGKMNQSAEQYLLNHCIEFEKYEFEAELGQPFCNYEDAVEFFEIYSRDADKSLINRQNIMSRLVKSNIEGFEFYMPHKKPSLILVMEKNK